MSEIFAVAGTPSVQRCESCGATWPELDASATCRSCDGLLAIVQPTPTAHGAALLQRFGSRCCTHPGSEASGVWRFAELVMPTATSHVTHPEGNTPLLRRTAVQTYAGVAELWLKHEGQNPTGSFKDRGMTVAVTQAARVGARAVACASTGNTSASLASYAAHAGIPALVLVPRGQVAMGKLTQSLAYGARTLLVDGSFDDCLRLVREASAELGVYLVNSVNPWRIEGQKTIVFELLQQRGWQAPDWIALPAGNLGNTSAFGKALREAHALGLIDRVPRLLAVQAAGAAPFATAFADDFATHPCFSRIGPGGRQVAHRHLRPLARGKPRPGREPHAGRPGCRDAQCRQPAILRSRGSRHSGRPPLAAGRSGRGARPGSAANPDQRPDVGQL